MTILKKTLQGLIACFRSGLEKRLPEKRKVISFKYEFAFCFRRKNQYLRVFEKNLLGLSSHRIIWISIV